MGVMAPDMGMRFSRFLALTFGVLAPVGETVRRWSTWREYPPAIADDYLMGALLLWGAWAAGRDPRRGRAALATAWGFTCGLGYYSFFEQVRRNGLGEIDPAPIPSSWMAAIKGIGLVFAALALVLTLRSSDDAAERLRPSEAT
jgi:hypothetical protein